LLTLLRSQLLFSFNTILYASSTVLTVVMMISSWMSYLRPLVYLATFSSSLSLFVQL
jgi:hypothetical protein